MGNLLVSIGLVIIAGTAFLPLESHAEAEQIYVSWADIDYIESNPILGWIEDIKYQMADASPFLSQLLLLEEVASGLDEEIPLYED